MNDFDVYEKSGNKRAFDNIRYLLREPADVYRVDGYKVVYNFQLEAQPNFRPDLKLCGRKTHNKK